MSILYLVTLEKSYDGGIFVQNFIVTVDAGNYNTQMSIIDDINLCRTKFIPYFLYSNFIYNCCCQSDYSKCTKTEHQEFLNIEDQRYVSLDEVIKFVWREKSCECCDKQPHMCTYIIYWISKTRKVRGQVLKQTLVIGVSL